MLIPAFQSFANLSAVSRDFQDILISNTWNKIYFKFASKDSPEMAAEILGKQRQYMHSVSRSENEGESAANLRATPQGSASKGGGHSESWRETEDFRVTPDQLRSLGMGEAFVMSGARVFHIKTPMLKFPDKIPLYEVSRRKVSVPANEKGLELEKRYKDFLIGPGDDADYGTAREVAEQREADAEAKTKAAGDPAA